MEDVSQAPPQQRAAPNGFDSSSTSRDGQEQVPDSTLLHHHQLQTDGVGRVRHTIHHHRWQSASPFRLNSIPQSARDSGNPNFLAAANSPELPLRTTAIGSELQHTLRRRSLNSTSRSSQPSNQVRTPTLSDLLEALAATPSSDYISYHGPAAFVLNIFQSRSHLLSQIFDFLQRLGASLLIINTGTSSFRQPNREELGLFSVFRCRLSQEDLALNPVAVNRDRKMWEAGFNTAIFARSARLFPGGNPILTPYCLHGDHSAYENYNTTNSQFARETAAWNKLATVVDPNLSHAPLAPDFEKLATAFFNGDPIYADIPDRAESSGSSTSHSSDETPQSRTPPEIKNHVISYGTSHWGSIQRDEVFCDNVLTLFLQDVIISNEMEEALRMGRLYLRLGITRHQNYDFVNQHLNTAGPSQDGFPEEIIAVGDDVEGDVSRATWQITDVTPRCNNSHSNTNQSDLVSVHSHSDQESKKKKKKKRSSKRTKKSRHEESLETTPPCTIIGGKNVSATAEKTLSPPSHMIEDFKESKTVGKATTVAVSQKLVAVEHSKVEISKSPEEEIKIGNSLATANVDVSNNDTQDFVDDGTWSVVTRASHRSRGSSKGSFKDFQRHQEFRSNPTSNRPTRPQYQSQTKTTREVQKTTLTQIRKSRVVQRHTRVEGIDSEQVETLRVFNLEEYPAIASTIPKSSQHTANPIQDSALHSISKLDEGPNRFSQRSSSDDQRNQDELEDSFTLQAESTQTENMSDIPTSSDIFQPDQSTPLNSTNRNEGNLNSSSSLIPEASQSIPSIETSDGPQTPGVVNESVVGTTSPMERMSVPTKAISMISSDLGFQSTSLGVNSSNSDCVNLGLDNIIESPDAVSPDAVSPDTVSPGAASPVAASPDAVSPDDLSPDAVSPNEVSPDYVSPDAVSSCHASVDTVLPDAIPSDPVSPDVISGHVSPDDISSDPVSSGPVSSGPVSPGPVSSGHVSPDAISSAPISSDLASELVPPATPSRLESSGNVATERPLLPVQIPSTQYAASGHSIRAPIPAAQNTASNPPYRAPGVIYPQFGFFESIVPTDSAPIGPHFVGHGHPTYYGSANMVQSNAGPAEQYPPPLRTDLSDQQPRQPNQIISNCSYCSERVIASSTTPLVLCSGCGPTCNIRYCSTACLLVDSFNHLKRCVNYPASERMVSHDLPGEFVYIQNPIVPFFDYVESVERFRQRAFSMHCYSGPFPKLMIAWAKKHGYSLQGLHDFDVHEGAKRTGDYFIFRSRVTGSSARVNPNADVIFCISLRRDDPMKQALNRTLNACFLLRDARLIEFLFRLIRNFLVDEESFKTFPHTASSFEVINEFHHQFRREFDFDATMQLNPSENFRMEIEWPAVSGILSRLEYANPVLQDWIRL